METARSRFLRYVTYYTTSDEHTGASPSTERQSAAWGMTPRRRTGAAIKTGCCTATAKTPIAYPHTSLFLNLCHAGQSLCQREKPLFPLQPAAGCATLYAGNY